LTSIAVGLVCANHLGGQTVIVNNQNQTPDFADGSPDHVLSTRWLANKFTTDGSAYDLAVVNMTVGGNDTSSSFQVDIYSSAGGTPNTSLATLTGVTPMGIGLYPYVPSSQLQLSANTEYWLVAKVLSGNGDYFWHFVSNTMNTGVGIMGGFSVSTLQGATWSAEDLSFPRAFLVTGNAVVPEPSSYAAILGIAALCYGAYSRRRSRI
jgi:hypothetical protein